MSVVKASKANILALKVGDEIRECIDLKGGRPFPESRWTPFRAVEEILTQREVAGHGYVFAVIAAPYRPGPVKNERLPFVSNNPDRYQIRRNS